MVKRKHKHLLEPSRALLFQSRMPLQYWGKCVIAAAYLINRFPSKVLKGLNPYQILYGEVPSYTHLKVFGYLCYASIFKVGRDKFQAQVVPCVFLGYPFGQKAYKPLNLETHKVFVFRDVIFHEHVFPFLTFTLGTFRRLFPFDDYVSKYGDTPTTTKPSLPISQYTKSPPVTKSPIYALVFIPQPEILNPKT